MSGRKVFAVGEVLQAADVNDFLMDQSVMVFPGSAARGSAIPSPTEGMVTYREDDDTVEVFDGSAFVPVGASPAILQVVSTTKTDTFSVTQTTPAVAAVTGLTVSITPSSASSKVLVFVTASIGAGNANGASIRLTRDGSAIGVGAASGVKRQETGGSGDSESNRDVSTTHLLFQDSPETTSSVTYGIQVGAMEVGSQTVHVNRGNQDANVNTNIRTISTIIAMEVAG